MGDVDPTVPAASVYEFDDEFGGDTVFCGLGIHIDCCSLIPLFSRIPVCAH